MMSIIKIILQGYWKDEAHEFKVPVKVPGTWYILNMWCMVKTTLILAVITRIGEESRAQVKEWFQTLSLSGKYEPLVVSKCEESRRKRWEISKQTDRWRHNLESVLGNRSEFWSSQLKGQTSRPLREALSSCFCLYRPSFSPSGLKWQPPAEVPDGK